MKNILAGIHEAAAASQSRHALDPESRETVVIDLPDGVRAAQIHTVHFHGSHTGTLSRPAIHWRLFFELGGEQSGHSVEFNSQQMQIDFRTRLFVTYRRYHSSNRSTVHGRMPLPVKRGVTVGDVLSLVLDKKRDLYTLNSDGSGCRFWCLTVMEDLEEAGFIARGSVADLGGFLLALHGIKGNSLVPYPLYKGTFYG